MQNHGKTGEEILQEAREHVQEMTCEEYKNTIRRQAHHLLLDVRTEKEFEEGHIDDAVNVPRGSLEFRIEEVAPNRNIPIMICCATGRRAVLAAYTLQQMGYSDVRVLEGGFNEFCKLD